MATQHPDFDTSAVPAKVEAKCSCGRVFENPRGLHTHQGHMRGDDWDQPGTSRYWAHLKVVGRLP